MIPHHRPPSTLLAASTPWLLLLIALEPGCRTLEEMSRRGPAIRSGQTRDYDDLQLRVSEVAVVPKPEGGEQLQFKISSEFDVRTWVRIRVDAPGVDSDCETMRSIDPGHFEWVRCKHSDATEGRERTLELSAYSDIGMTRPIERGRMQITLDGAGAGAVGPAP